MSRMITVGYALPNPLARKSSTRSETSDRPLSPIPTNAGNGSRWAGRLYRSIASLSNSSTCSSGRRSTSSNSLSLLVTGASYLYVDSNSYLHCLARSGYRNSSRLSVGTIANPHRYVIPAGAGNGLAVGTAESGRCVEYRR